MLVKLEKEKNDLAEALEKQTADIAALEKRHYDVAHALAIENKKKELILFSKQNPTKCCICKFEPKLMIQCRTSVDSNDDEVFVCYKTTFSRKCERAVNKLFDSLVCHSCGESSSSSDMKLAGSFLYCLCCLGVWERNYRYHQRQRIENFAAAIETQTEYEVERARLLKRQRENEVVEVDKPQQQIKKEKY